MDTTGRDLTEVVAEAEEEIIETVGVVGSLMRRKEASKGLIRDA